MQAVRNRIGHDGRKIIGRSPRKSLRQAQSGNDDTPFPTEIRHARHGHVVASTRAGAVDAGRHADCPSPQQFSVRNPTSAVIRVKSAA